MIKAISQRKLIASGYWLSTFCEGAAWIIIPLYFTSVGVPVKQIAYMFFFYEAFGLLTNMYSGFFVNRYGYKNAFLISLILHSVASFGYIFLTPRIDIAAIFLINILRSTRGIAKELIRTTSSAYFKHLSTDRKRIVHAQVLLGGQEVLKGIGLLIGSAWLAFFGFKWSFTILGLITFACFVAAWALLEDYREKKQIRYGKFFKVKGKMFILALARLFLYAGRDIWLVIAIPIYLSEIGFSTITVGTILAVGVILFGLVQPLSGVVVKKKIKLGPIRLKSPWRHKDMIMPTSLLLTVLPLFLFIDKTNYFYILFLIIIYNIIAGIATAPHNHLHLKLAKQKRAAVDIGFYKSVAQIGKLGAALASGYVYEGFGIDGCLVLSSAMLFLSALLGSFFFFNRKKKEKKKKPQPKEEEVS